MAQAERAYPPTHPFQPDPKATWPAVYCVCGYDIDVHADKGTAVAGPGHVGNVPVSASEPNPPKAGR